MKIKLLKTIMVLSKWFLYIFSMHFMFFTLAAAKTNSQQLSVNDIHVNIEIEKATAAEVFEAIELNSQFEFAYDEKDLDKKILFTFSGNSRSIASLLKEVGQKASLRFRRVNDKIAVAKASDNSKAIEEVFAATTVTGEVTDELGDGLPGVTVMLKGTTVGAITDMNGGYSVNVPDNQATNGILVYSFVGYLTEELQISGRTVIDIQMTVDIQTLQEVVVIGYQTVKKEDLTGATSIIDPEQSAKISAGSLAESIQGLTPGVTVRNNGNPANGAQIEIRGAASFLNTSPLYVIDGMIADAGPNLSPNNIESIQILKDASAAAIYGSRAANGVVIITTKQGSEGPPKLQVSAKYGISEMPKGYDVMNATEYAALTRQQYLNSGQAPPASVGMDNSFVPAYDTDWQDEITRLGNQQDYNLTLSGGSSNSKYLLSGGYYNHEGVVVGNSFDRFNFRVNTSGKRGRFSFGENFVVNHARIEAPNQGNAFYDMVTMLPVIPVRADEYITDVNPTGWGIGSADAVTYSWNTLAVNAINPSNSNTTKAVGNAYVKFEISDWLSYKFNAGLEARFTNDQLLLKEGIWRYTMQRGPTAVEEGRGAFSSLLFDHTLNFDKEIDKHVINGVVGYSSQETKSRYISARRTDLQSFNGEYLQEINSATGESAVTGNTGQHFRTQGFLGRVNYIYDERYQLTVTGRYDQDSRFAEQYRSGFFPSVAGAWRVSNESFFNSDIISLLKLRASYGELGIVTVGSWDYIALLNSGQRAVFGPNQTPYVGANQAQLTNPDLRWEKRKMQNIGIDVGLFNDQFGITAEWYSSVSSDALLNQVLPRYLGNLGGNPPVNAGGISNKGIELSLSYRDREGPFKWDISGNLTTIKNKVESVGDQGEGINYIQTGISRSQEGRPMAEWYVIKTAGIFQTPEEVTAHTSSDGTIIQPLAQPGDIRYVDLNDDGVINQEDRDFAGSPWPTLQTGLQFNASYRDFTLNLQFLGIFGNTLYNDVRKSLDNYNNSNFRSDINPWSPDNRSTDDPRIGVLTNDPGLSSNAMVETDRWLESGSYVRLRNIELAYNLPSTFAERLNVSSARLYISGQNLFTVTEYTGPDPDVTGGGVHQRGLDNGNWPSDRIYSVGVQLEF